MIQPAVPKTAMKRTTMKKAPTPEMCAIVDEMQNELLCGRCLRQWWAWDDADARELFKDQGKTPALPTKPLASLGDISSRDLELNRTGGVRNNRPRSMS